MAGSTWLQASQEWFPQWRFCWECPHHAEHYAKCPSWQHWMERFWLSVFAKGQLNDISKNVLSKRFWLSVYARGQKNRYLILRFLLSFTAQGQSKLKKQALQQPQLGAGRLLETNTKKKWWGQQCLKTLQKRKSGFLTELYNRGICDISWYNDIYIYIYMDIWNVIFIYNPHIYIYICMI